MKLQWQDKKDIAENLEYIGDIKFHLEKYPDWKIPTIDQLLYAYNIKENDFKYEHYFCNKNSIPYLIHFGKYFYSSVPIQTVISPYKFNIRLVR